MAFSGAVRLGDLNDFIAPSQACVVSLQGGKVALDQDSLEADAQVHLYGRRPAFPNPSTASSTGGGFKQTYTEGEGGPLKVSLHDCLACSGCVTSAETVLLQHQSRAELEAKLRDPGALVVVSVSPQSRASLATLHDLPAEQVQGKLAAFLAGRGAVAVLDTAEARELSRAEAAAEFIERYRRSQQCSTSGGSGAAAPPPPPLPLLASACPGWVCYAEKTHADLLLPRLSAVKSPQAVAGSYVKRQLAGRRGWDPARVYHCTVMPCYDKKLEAARGDLTLPGAPAVPEVDASLTTGELQGMLDAAGVQLASLPAVPWVHMAVPGAQPGAAGTGVAAAATAMEVDAGAGPAPGRQQGLEQGPLLGPQPAAGGGSGGYLEHVLRAAAAQLLGVALPPGPLAMRAGRNADLREVEVCNAAGQKLRFAAAYGFRNIQGLVRKLRGGRAPPYDYVEVMACPGGCLNGGGQLKPRPGQTAAQLLDQLEALYHPGALAEAAQAQQQQQQQQQQACSSAAGVAGMQEDGAGCCGGEGEAGCQAATCCTSVGACACGGGGGGGSGVADALYAGWVGGAPGSEAAQRLLHTQFHKRDAAPTGALLGDW